MIIGAIIQCLCSLFILYYYYKNYRHNSDDFLPSEVSYFTIQSIILSFLSAILLSKDANKRNRLFRQFGQKPKNRLSYMQRQLIVLEILVIFYIIIGGLIYSKLEGWTFNDAVYFAIITLMTCGTGDFSPNTFAGRLLLIVYAIPGILLTAYTVYSIYSVISEILYAKVYKDFSRFINVNNDIFFQNLVKHDQVVNHQNPLPSPSQDNNNNDNTHEFDLPSTSNNIDLITCEEPLSISETDENNNITTNSNTNNDKASTNYENGLIILNTNISSSSSSVSYSNINDENSIDKPAPIDNPSNPNNPNNQIRRRNLANSYNINISNWNDEDHYYYEPRHSILINDSTGIRFGPVYQYDDNDAESSSSSEDDSYYSDANNSESDHSELEHLINKKQNHNNSNINNNTNNNNKNNSNNNNNNNSNIKSAVSSPINHIYNNELAKKSTSSLHSYYSRYSYQRSFYRKNIINANRYNSLSANDDNDSNNGLKSLMLTRRNTLNPNQNNVLKGMAIYSSSNNEIDAEKVLKQTRDLNLRQLKLSLGVLSLIIVFFSLIYSWIENWSFFEAVYFCFVNLCTIGYGDFVPKTVYGKSIYIYFIYIAVPSTTWLGTVLFELATGRWEVYIEQTDLEDELIRNDFDRQIKIDSRKNSNESKESRRRKSKSKERADE